MNESRGNRKLVVLAANDVGLECAMILANVKADIGLVVTDESDPGAFNGRIRALAEQMQWRVTEWRDLLMCSRSPSFPEFAADLGISAWWPRIIREPLLEWPRDGWINLHPSLLPFNRGKHPNFWTLLDGTPAGGSVHFIDASIDGGDIISQAEIEVSWTDSGETVHRRTKDLCVRLFEELVPTIVAGEPLPRRAQPPSAAPVHFSHELELASEIRLDETYTARRLLNLLRARTFPPYPGAFFVENDERFVVRVTIERTTDE